MLLEVGVIPEAAQQFQTWTLKFQEKVHTLEFQVKQHSAYSDLVADFHHLGDLRQFNVAFLLSGQDVFSVIASTISSTIESIISRVRADWKEYHDQFLSMTKLVGPQLNAAALEKLKANMFGLIQKLKVVWYSIGGGKEEK